MIPTGYTVFMAENGALNARRTNTTFLLIWGSIDGGGGAGEHRVESKGESTGRRAVVL